MVRHRKILLLVVIIQMACTSVYAEDLLFVGDSIANGGWGDGVNVYYSTNMYTSLVTALGGNLTYVNKGVNGNVASGVNSTLSAELSSYTPSSVICHVGTNDLAFGGNGYLNTYLTNIEAIRVKCVGASADLTINQIIPRSDLTAYIKLWNAALENWAYTNSVKLAPTYQEMSDLSTSHEDYLSSDYGEVPLTGVHPNPTGYTYMGGTLIPRAKIPERKRVWGASSYPDFGYVSWRWAVLTGTAVVSEDNDKGVISLAQNATADLTVECMPTGTKTVNISSMCRYGNIVIYYRTTATTNFARNAAASWTAYTGAFSTTDQFIQIRLKNETASSAVVKYAGLTWSGSALGVEVDPDPTSSPTITSGYSGTASWQ